MVFGVVVGGYNGGSEIFSELGFEHLDYIHEAFFEGGGKFHVDPSFLEGVFHDVVMVFARLYRDLVFGFSFGQGWVVFSGRGIGFLLGIGDFFCLVLKVFGSIRVMN